MAREVPDIALNNGVEIPALGLGVFQTPPDETRDAVRSALGAGYRHIDTAAAYGNERQVGEAVHESDLDRSEVFLETKVWISDYGYDETLHAFEKSARKLGVDQIDLLILHQALPPAFDRTLEAYRALETLLEGRQGPRHRRQQLHGRAPHGRSSNARRWCRRSTRSRCTPTSAATRCRTFDAEHGIVTQAWSPIGGITFYREGEPRQHAGGPGHRRRRQGPRQEPRPR